MNPITYLEMIENRGHSCYIVGGYVRDMLLGIPSTDVDIATSATPKEIKEIFSQVESDNLGSIRIIDGSYTIDITTFRKESSYYRRHPEIEYIADIDEDLSRRDFTINAICMDSHGDIYDPLGGERDLKAGIIRVIGDVKTKFEEDPLRILRAARLSIIYGFTIENEARKFMTSATSLLKDISYARKKIELNKIVIAKGHDGLLELDSLGLLKALDIEVPENYRDIRDLMGVWAQLKCEKYPFSKIEKTRMQNIREIVSNQKIDITMLFKYDIYDCLVAGEILEIQKGKILDMYEAMPVHSLEDLALDGRDIKKLLNIADGPEIREIKKDLLRQVLSGNLPNSESDLSDYIRKKWK